MNTAILPPQTISSEVHLPEHRALWELLAATRRKSGLTQQVVAKCLQRPQSFVAKYEGGERRLDLIEFVAVASALDVDPIRLFRALLRRIG